MSDDLTALTKIHPKGNSNPKDLDTIDQLEPNKENESDVMDMDSELCAALHPDTSGQPETTIAPKDVLSTDTETVPFNNGHWVPVVPEAEDEIYWWAFPWRFKFNYSDAWRNHFGNPMAIWKLVAGRTITHLPEHCLYLMTPGLFYRRMHRPRVAPQVIDFGRKYEGVLEYFTERMLGINDFIPATKRGLLNELFEYCSYQRSLEIFDLDGLAPDLYPI